MGEMPSAVDLLLLLICGFTSTAFLKGQGLNDKVMNFHLLAAKSAKDAAVSDASSTYTTTDQQQDDWRLLSKLHLCHPQGSHWAGFEGLTPQGLNLDKVYILVVSPPSLTHNLPLPTHPPCPSFQQVTKLSHSSKVHSYPELVADYRQLHGSKSGLGVFPMLPEGCGPEDAPAWALTRMVQLGEYLGGRYRQVWGWMGEVGRDVVKGRSMGEGPAFQSVSALLHGLLEEKQFLRTAVGKLGRGVVRGVGSHQPCAAIADIEPFMEKAYMEEKEVFRGRKLSGAESTYANLGVGRDSTAKQVRQSLQHLACSTQGELCSVKPCLNLTQKHLHQLHQAIAQHNSYLSSSPVFFAYAVADTSLHLHDLLAWFSKPSTEDDPAIRVDVADDFFFLKLVSALGHQVDRPVVPGSRLVIEQYRKNRPQEAMRAPRFWRVLVDGEVVTDSLKACGSGAAAKGVCGVDSIKTRLQDWVRNNMFGACSGEREEL